jgi:glucose dehydrogenase
MMRSACSTNTLTSQSSPTGRTVILRRLVTCGVLLFGMCIAYADETVEKSVYLVVEDDRIIASNVQTGQFFDFDFSAKEKLQQQIVANGVAVVVTNQRYAGIGVFSGGWQSIRRIAGESVISAEAQDYSALIVTSDRVLAFNGRSGSWSDRKR